MARQANMILKLAAVGSAIVLVGGFVAYRAGAFDRLRTPTESSPLTEEVPGPNLAPQTEESPTIMVGSKSAPVFTQPQSAPPSTTTQPPKQVFLGGSKSLAPLIPP